MDQLTNLLLLGGALCVVAAGLLWCLPDPRRAFLLVVLSTPFVANPSSNQLLMRIGLPEIVFTFFMFVWIWSLVLRRPPLRRPHAVHAMAVALVMVAGFSFVGADTKGLRLGLIEVAILGYLVMYCLVSDQFLTDEEGFRKVLDFWMLAGAVVAVIGLYECLAVVAHLPRINVYRDPYRVIATFRRPPQLGVYALSTFFVAVAYSMLPDMSARKRMLLRLLAAAMVVLIFFSSRRSAMASLAAGMFLMIIFNAGQLRRACVLGLLFATAIYGAQYLIGSDPDLNEFFGERIKVLYSPEEIASKSFLKDNLNDALTAFDNHPYLGVGYGHFALSEYSSNGNEVHSTPLRVVAECGVVGSLVYGFLTLAFLYLGWRNIGQAQGTRWSAFTRVFFPGLLALQVSYMYNRALRDRTYWLIIALVVAMSRILADRRAAAPPAELEPGPGAGEADEAPGLQESATEAGGRGAGEPGQA